ncbi:MAG TPA: AAA family ATPase [Candidatus Angelobacter sp.]|nr:AAA family ATPase [Candidatus Angelobacter sp.]
MSIDALVELIHAENQGNWSERNKQAFESLFGSPKGRYPKLAERTVTLRAPSIDPETGVPFSAYIHPSNPQSGPYSGLSFVIFPSPGEPSLVGLVVGTQGLAPDEMVLGRPGHARKAQAICAWLNREFGKGTQVAWAKQDPTQTEISVPDELRKKWAGFKSTFDRYGKVIYALVKPDSDMRVTREAVTALLDLVLEERGYLPNKDHMADRDRIRSNWFSFLMPDVSQSQVAELLAERRFVIIQGPPGTGKTTMAENLLAQNYRGVGRTIQFHPNTTYEAFIGGLAPTHSQGELGLQFRPTPGFLMEAATDAKKDPQKPYLLDIEEINRADLAKILGESITLLEARAERPRETNLQHDFGPPFHRTFKLPDNLHILGTMNSADRSIAIVDVAVRRRFSFVSLWPQMTVVEKHGCKLMQDAFKDLVGIFMEHANEDAFSLVPGHSYFLERDEKKAGKSLQVSLAPLLEEYLAQGYVSGFAEPIRSYLQWLRSL